MNSLSNQIHEHFYKITIVLLNRVSEQVSNQVRDKEYFQVRTQVVN